MEPIFITKNGYGDLVIMSLETYEAMLQTNELDAAIAEAEFASEGKLIDAREPLSSLRSNLDRYTVKLLSRAYRDWDGIYDYIANVL